MASTYLSLYFHLIFATKGREPLINSSWRPRLHRYLGGAVNSLGGRGASVGGTEDHVHVLAELRAAKSLADFMRDLKKGSSMWIHQELKDRGFAWQGVTPHSALASP